MFEMQLLKLEIIKVRLEAAEESDYAGGNITQRLVKIVSKTGSCVDRASELVVGGDTVCTGIGGVFTSRSVKSFVIDFKLQVRFDQFL